MPKFLKIIFIVIFLLMLTAPWMNKIAVSSYILQKYGNKDGSIDKNGNIICDYKVMWVPFGRWVASCENGYFVPFFNFKRENNDNIKKQSFDKNSSDSFETTNWKTYKIQKYGVVMNYPSNWRVEEVGEDMLTFVSSDVFEQSSNLMVGIRRKGEESYIGFSTGRGVDEFVQKGNTKISDSVSKPYFSLGENRKVRSVEFRNLEGGELVEVGNFEIVAKLHFIYDPEFKNIEENIDYQISQKILELITLGD